LQEVYIGQTTTHDFYKLVLFNIIFLNNLRSRIFFILIKENKITLRSKEKCIICGEKLFLRFNPMEEWCINGILCGKCYSKRIDHHYPGDHIRINKEK
jgi:hypothetical protein